jgi:hypothetical protein
MVSFLVLVVLVSLRQHPSSDGSDHRRNLLSACYKKRKRFHEFEIPRALRVIKNRTFTCNFETK